jgi:uncharacterized short protein YbdD (DUF466 family)
MSSVREALTGLRWFFRGVVGADAYERYCEHQARTHPGAPVMDKKTFWREKWDDAERNPRTRCC